MRLNRRFPGLLIVLMMILPGCLESGPSAEERQNALEKLNKNTMSVAVSLKSMLDTEQALEERQAMPLKVDLQTWWISLTATRLNLKRIKATLTEYPGTIDAARNLWAGRVQGSLELMIESGMLTTMTGPITSQLEKNYGKSRVEKEAREVMEISAQISTLLGIKLGSSTE